MIVVGIQKTEKGLRCSAFSKQGHLLFLQTFSCYEKCLQTLRDRFQDGNFWLAFSVPACYVLVRCFSSSLKKSLLRKTLPFEIETLFPYAQEGVFAPVIQVESAVSWVTLFGIAKSQLVKVIEDLKSTGLEFEVMTCAQQALFRFCQRFFSKSNAFIACYLDQGEGFAILIKNNVLIASVTLPQGDAENLERGIGFLHQKAAEVKQIYIAASEEGNWKAMFERLQTDKLDIEFVDAALCPYVLSMGSALDVMAGKYSVRFEKTAWQGELVEKKAIAFLKKQAKLVLFVNLLLLMCGCCSYLWAKGKIHKNLKGIVQHYPFLHKVHEKKFTDQLREVERLAKRPLTFKEEKKAPLVADLLLYLTEHPKLQAEVEITDFSYSIEGSEAIVSLRLRAAFGDIEAFYKDLLQDTQHIVPSSAHYKREANDHKVEFRFKG